MRAAIIVIVALIGTACGGLAYDLTDREGKVYKEIKLRDKTDLGILIAHENGVVFLDYSTIPVPDLWTFGYDEEKYEQAKARAADQRSLNSLKSLQSTVSANTPAPARPAGTTRLYKPTRSSSSTSTSSSGYRAPRSSSSHSRQCAGITQKGYRCRRMVASGSYCYQHP